jgi:putative PEP-CTERM system histidine kinase
MNFLALLSSGVGAAAFLFFAMLLLLAPGDRQLGRWIIGASAVSALWFISIAGAVSSLFESNKALASLIQIFELTRDAAWILVLAHFLRRLLTPAHQRAINLGMSGLALVLLLISVLTLAPSAISTLLTIQESTTRKISLLCLLAVALFGLFLVEQLFRHTARSSRWALKHFCMGLGLLFTFDFYLYADAVLFNRIDEGVWSSRGFINALAVPMMVISASRNREWDLKIFVSRQVVFHSVTFLMAGAYLMTMAAAGYYVRASSGQWGVALQAVFVAAALIVMLSLFASTQLRARLMMFIARHFYRNKYEYGDQWLKFTQTLAASSLDPQTLNATVLSAICEVIDSPGGAIFSREPSGGYCLSACCGGYEFNSVVFGDSSPFILALEESNAAWDAGVQTELNERTLSLLPAALAERREELPLLVPIVHEGHMLAFLALSMPRGSNVIDSEDRNLLRTICNQAASYLALLRATDQLSESRQFETFNRLSAFLVHDLKNVVAQLALIRKNAERHLNNPEFVADAFETVGSAVDRMNRMLASLRQVRVEAEPLELIDLRALVDEAVKNRSASAPQPQILNGDGSSLRVRGARERLLAVIEHLLQNAIEATPADGTVKVSLTEKDGFAVISVHDTGCGMDEDFIARRLFKPFDTTKGKAGMGIGVYESRHVIENLGGHLVVKSSPGEGTDFRVSLPVVSTG